MAKDQSNHVIADSLRSFSHFQEKTHDQRNRERVVLEFLTIFNSYRTKFGKQKIGDEGDTPNIESRWSKTLNLSVKKREVLSGNTVSLDRIAYSSAVPVLFSETLFLWIRPLFRR